MVLLFWSCSLLLSLSLLLLSLSFALLLEDALITLLLDERRRRWRDKLRRYLNFAGARGIGLRRRITLRIIRGCGCGGVEGRGSD